MTVLAFRQTLCDYQQTNTLSSVTMSNFIKPALIEQARSKPEPRGHEESSGIWWRRIMISYVVKLVYTEITVAHAPVWNAITRSAYWHS